MFKHNKIYGHKFQTFTYIQTSTHVKLCPCKSKYIDHRKAKIMIMFVPKSVSKQ